MPPIAVMMITVPVVVMPIPAIPVAITTTRSAVGLTVVSWVVVAGVCSSHSACVHTNTRASSPFAGAVSSTSPPATRDITRAIAP